MLEIDIYEIISEIIKESVIFSLPFGLILGGSSSLLGEGLNLVLKLFKS